MSSHLFAGIDQERGPLLSVAALVDIGFLLLTFFIVSTTLQRQEANLNVRLPELSSAAATTQLEAMRIRVTAQGALELNQQPLSLRPGQRDVDLLVERLERYAAVAAMSGSTPRVIIDCDDAAAEQRFIDVLNACSRANLPQVSVLR